MNKMKFYFSTMNKFVLIHLSLQKLNELEMIKNDYNVCIPIIV